MNLNNENKNKIEKLLQEFLKNLNETNQLNEYQKNDIREELDKIINELSKQPENQDKSLIDHRFKNLWEDVKNIITVSSSLISIADTLGISL